MPAGEHIMFGVIRRASLQQTRLHRNFVGSDRALLVELALLGRFRSTSGAPVSEAHPC